MEHDGTRANGANRSADIHNSVARLASQSLGVVADLLLGSLHIVAGLFSRKNDVPEVGTRNSFKEARPSCCTLVYSPCPGFRKSFPRLIRTLQATVPKNEPWLLLGPLKENACSAEFRTGPTGNTVVTIGALDCSLVLKAKVLTGDIIFPQIRSWIEDGILATYPGLDCSVYVSPCTPGSGKDWLKVVCVHNSTLIGSLRKVHTCGTDTSGEDIKMMILYCPHHRKFLRPERYQHWFGLKFVHYHLRNSFKKKQEKILMDIAKEIGTRAALYEIATHLNVRKIDVDAEMANFPYDFKAAAYSVLHKWYRSQSSPCLHYQRKDQLANAFEAAGLDKECVYHVYDSVS